MQFKYLVFYIVAVFVPAASNAKISHRVAILAGAEMGVQPEFGAHGIGILAYDLEGLPRGMTFSAELNTDTLRLRLERIRFMDGELELGAYLTGEALLAGLQTDYFRQGEKDPSRGFNASYAAAGLSGKWNPVRHHYLELALGFRHWFFAANGDTDPSFTLPPDTWAQETRLRYTYWGVKHDLSWRDRHRLYPRIRGVAFGLDVGADVRGETHLWGTLDSASVDTRNDPERASFSARQWLLYGLQIMDRVRTQVRQEAFIGGGLDDLNRSIVGGLNPYVVPLAGAPWAAFRSHRHLALRWSWHFRLYDQLEAGLMGDLVWLADPGRDGGSQMGTQAGVGLFADWQLGAFQIDVAVGWCPTLQWEAGGSLGALAALGWQWG